MKVTVLFLFCIAMYGFGANAGDYWPIGMTSTYLYVNDHSEILEVTYQNDVRISRYIRGGGIYRVTEIMHEDSEGDIFISSTERYLEGTIDPIYHLFFTPDLKFIDLPLQVGDSWVSTSQASGLYYQCSVEISFHVVAEVEVTVPAGTFTALEIAEYNVNGCPSDPLSGIYLLNREIGPVMLPGGFKLARIDGNVSEEARNWGSVKALYR